jgi:osmotically-inducible protein OsmY
MHNRYGTMGDERDGFYGQQGRGEYGYRYEGRSGQGGHEGRSGYEVREDRFGHEDRGFNEPYGREGRFSQEGRYNQEGRFGQEGRGWNEPYGRESRFGHESREGRLGQEGRGWDEPYTYERHARGRGFGVEPSGQERSHGGMDYSRSYGQHGGQGYQGWSDQQGVPLGYGQHSNQGWGGQRYQRWGGQQDVTGFYGQPWGQGQMHQGRGPKGYKRSDDRIREDVCDRLTDHPEIDASDIEVKVQNGEITLTGTVPERRIKHMVEQLVEWVAGVQDVHNQLRAKREDASKHYTGTAQGQGDKNGPLQETSRSQEGRRSVST